MSKRTPSLNLNPLGGNPNTPRSLLPHGSPEWCHRTIARLRWALDEIHVSESEYGKILGELTKYRAWEVLPTKENPYGSLDELLRAELGLSGEDAKKKKVEQQAKVAQPLKVIGAPKANQNAKKADPEPVDDLPFMRAAAENKVSNRNIVSGGTRANYLADRIARDRPDILDRMKAGEFSSVRKAAIEAGIVAPEFSVPSEPLGAARRLLRHFRGDPLRQLIDALVSGLDGQTEGQEA